MTATLTPLVSRVFATVDADPDELRVVRDELADALTQWNWTDEDQFRVLICADEVMANAFSHGSVAGDQVDVRFTVTDTRVVLLVGDPNTQTDEVPSVPSLPDESSEHGRGLLIIQALADTFRVWRRPAGTLVALAFRPESLRALEGDAR